MTVPLHINRYGSGRPLLILHGLFGSSSNWRAIARRLSKNAIEVVTADLRNHGASPWSDSMDYLAMAADVKALIRNKFDQSPMIAGHSMGGKVAICLALQEPSLITGLVAMDIAPISYHHNHLSLIEALRSLNLLNIHKRSEADASLAGPIPDPMLRGFLLQNLTYHNDCYDWRLNLPVLAQSMSTLTDFPEFPPAAHYSGPTLFLRGANSHYIPDSALPVIEQLFPSAKVRSIANAGHWLHAEQPDAIVMALREFITTHTD